MALVPALALFLTATLPLDLGLAPRPAAAPAGGCPAGARVEVNLAAWRAALEQAADAKRRDDLLGEVRLALDLPEPDGAQAREPRLRLAGVEDAVVQLEAGERADHVLHVRYRLESVEDAPTLHLVQVLRPLGGRAYCALGSGPSAADAAPSKLVSYALTFVPLVSAKAKVIQVESAMGEARQSETRRAYWVARGWQLHKIFDEALGHMESAEGGATTTTVATMSLSGEFPKKIDLAVVTRRGGCEVRAGDTPCEGGGGAPATTTTFVYDGAKYVRKK